MGLCVEAKITCSFEASSPKRRICRFRGRLQPAARKSQCHAWLQKVAHGFRCVGYIRLQDSAFARQRGAWFQRTCIPRCSPQQTGEHGLVDERARTPHEDIGMYVSDRQQQYLWMQCVLLLVALAPYSFYYYCVSD